MKNFLLAGTAAVALALGALTLTGTAAADAVITNCSIVKPTYSSIGDVKRCDFYEQFYAQGYWWYRSGYTTYERSYTSPWRLTGGYADIWAARPGSSWIFQCHQWLAADYGQWVCY